MAGKLFPEMDIGDSEEVCKRSPGGKKPLAPPKDAGWDSPPCLGRETSGSDILGDSGDLKEGEHLHNKEAGKDSKAKQEPGSPPKEEGEVKKESQRTPSTNLLDFRWLQEKEEEEGSLQEQPGIVLEDTSSQGSPPNNSAGDAVEGLWPPPGVNTEEHLQPRVTEVFPSDTSKPGLPESTAVDHEAYYLCDDDEETSLSDCLSDSGASRGYFPCYRTYVEFPRYQPPGSPQDKGSRPPRPSRKKIPPAEGQGPQDSPPPPPPLANVSRKCPQKRKHRGTSEKEKGAVAELKPLLQDQRSLPPSPEEKVSQVKARGKKIAPWGSSSCSESITEHPSTPSRPHRSHSRLSLQALMSWVRKVFQKAQSPQPTPQASTSTSTGAQAERRPFTTLRLWISQYRGRVHPQPQ